MKEQNFLYIEKETDKAFLLVDPRGSFWIPKSIADRHPNYNFLAKPWSFFEKEYSNEFKRWKRKEVESLSFTFMEVRRCKTCGGGDEEWFFEPTEIDYNKDVFCPSCGWKIRDENRDMTIKIISDNQNILRDIRGFDFVKHNHIKDFELFTSAHLVSKAQLRILDQDMREYGGYYERGMAGIEDFI